MGLTVSGTGVPAGFAGTSAYQYDGHDQLKNEQSSRLGSYTNTFSYDGAGNPTTFRGVDPTGGKGYNVDNQNAAYTFDNDGNPTSWQGNALTFDAGNHLTKLVNGAVTVLTAGYNAEGLRAWKQSAVGSTYYVYDGLTPVVELDGNGNVTAVNTWGAAGLAGRHTTAGSGSSTFYTFDVQGSVSQRLSSNGTVQGTYGFDSYGNRVGTDNSADPYSGFGAQFGYLRDSETGLSLCGERYYDPGQGRWLNRDPIGYGGGINVYAYVRSNPLGDVDPYGLVATRVMSHWPPWPWDSDPWVYDQQNGVWNATNSQFARLYTGGQTVTIGHLIRWPYGFNPGDPGQQAVYRHELVHVKQGDMMGPAYLPSILAGYPLGILMELPDPAFWHDPMRVGHDANPFECWADRESGNGDTNSSWMMRLSPGPGKSLEPHGYRGLRGSGNPHIVNGVAHFD